jgi:adenylate cyclase
MLIGPDVSRSAEVEAAARPREVVFTSEAASLLEDRCRLVSRNRGIFRLQRFTDGLPGGASGECRRRVSLERLRRYVLPSIQKSQSVTEQGRVAGDHRRVTALFINLLGMDQILARNDGAALFELNSYVCLLLGLLDRYGGVLLGSDVADHGEKLIAVFGAPESLERQEENAMRCAIELNDGLRASGSPLQHRIGLSSGFAFAGEIGSNHRRSTR